MVKHLIMWNFKEDFPEEKKEAFALEADKRIKALIGPVKGLTSAEIKLNRLPGSNRELMLLTDFDSPEDLAAYQVHPLHVAFGSELIKPSTCDRACFDFEI